MVICRRLFSGFLEDSQKEYEMRKKPSAYFGTGLVGASLGALGGGLLGASIGYPGKGALAGAGVGSLLGMRWNNKLKNKAKKSIGYFKEEREKRINDLIKDQSETKRNLPSSFSYKTLYNDPKFKSEISKIDPSCLYNDKEFPGMSAIKELEDIGYGKINLKRYIPVADSGGCMLFWDNKTKSFIPAFYDELDYADRNSFSNNNSSRIKNLDELEYEFPFNY